MAKRPFLRWLTDVPRPYTSVLFRALSGSERVDLEVHYGKATMGSHPWSQQVEAGFNSRLYRTRLGVDWGLVVRALREREAIFVIAGWNDPTMNLCALIRRLVGARYWIYTDTPDTSWVPRGPIKSALRRLWLRFVLGGADRVWGTGRPAQRLLGELGARPDRLANLPYFIELDRYRSGPRTAEGPVQLGSASQLVDRKDLKTALRALASLHDRGISNWRYRIVGTGPAEEGLRQEAAALGIADRVELVGWLEGDALVEFFATCDVFVHPCEFEPWGVVIMEAMASGAAIVASDRTYCAVDWVEPGVSGSIHRTWDADDLAQKLEWILADRDRIGRMGAAGREVVRRWPVSRGVEEIEARAGA